MHHDFSHVRRTNLHKWTFLPLTVVKCSCRNIRKHLWNVLPSWKIVLWKMSHSICFYLSLFLSQFTQMHNLLFSSFSFFFVVASPAAFFIPGFIFVSKLSTFHFFHFLAFLFISFFCILLSFTTFTFIDVSADVQHSSKPLGVRSKMVDSIYGKIETVTLPQNLFESCSNFRNS